MAKSLRWRLQAWHAAILGLVILGFGGALYFQMRRAAFRDIDEDLLSTARIIEANLQNAGPGPFPGPLPNFWPGNDRRPGPRSLPPPSFPPRPPGPSDFSRPSEEREPPDHRRRPESPFSIDRDILGDPPFRDFHDRELRGGLERQRSDTDANGDERWMAERERRGPREMPPYFAIFSPRGERVAGTPGHIESLPDLPSRPIEFRNEGPDRLLLLRRPSNHLIVVGRDTNPMLDGVNALLIPIALSGLVVLAAGLIGGWWLAGRAIEPLERISETASHITADQLQQRIDTSEMDSELSQLGNILNSMLQRLENSFEQQIRFVSDASHELRTPVSVMLMHCELALSRDRSSQEYQQTLSTCARASQRMRSLIEDLLILARADAGQLVARKEPIDLSQLVQECIELLSPMAEQRGITMNVDASPCPCIGDSDHLLRLINNLVCNAIIYNRPSGTVTILTSVEGETATLTVRDTGRGMTNEEVAQVFERFYRADEARSRETGGSGLGLSICKSIADAHGAEILVASEKDVGTTITVRLPTLLDQNSLV